MKIRILRNTVANKQAVVEGQIVDVPEAEAKLLIGIKKATAVEEPSAIETADAADEVVETTAVRRPKGKFKAS